MVRAAQDPSGAPVSGSTRPTVTVVIFTDYQCAICKQTDPALRRRLAADAGLRVVWKDWPIRGAASTEAARVALAADRQGRYAPVHDALMAARGALTPERITAIAVSAGADPQGLAADRVTHAATIDRQLALHSQQAFGLGLQGTPAYLIGQDLIQGGLDDRALEAAIRRARR